MVLKSKKLWLTVILLALAGGGYYWWTMPVLTGGADAAEKKDSPDRTYTVKRNDLILGISSSGSVNARKKHKLSLEANLGTKLLWVIDENTHVKEGDVLARFDAENLNNTIEDGTVELDNLEKELEVLIQQQNIQVSTDAESLRTALDRLDKSEDALRKYRRYELRQSRDSLDAKISEAETALTKARNDYDDFQSTLATANSSDQSEQAKLQAELETKKKAITTAEKALETAESNRKVFQRYDNPTKIRDLENSVEQDKLNLEKVKVSIDSQTAKDQRQIDNTKIRIRRKTKDLEQQKSYVPMMELTAPVDGIVLYGDSDSRWGRVDVKLGMDVHRGMVLITIPDMKKMIVEFDLPEIYRSKVEVGNEIIITPDSLQGVKYKGRLDSIDTLPVNWLLWDQNSPKIYKCKIEIEDPDERLVNGMNVQLQIVTGVVKDALAVPVEAVFEEGSKFFVYKVGVTGPKEEPVTLGRSNDTFVEITEGIEEDDVVYLYRPFQKREGDK